MGILKRLLGLLPLAAAGLAAAATPVATEYQLKAVFLFNFAQFVQWPAAVFDSAVSPLSICVLGEDPFGSDLDEIVRGESVMGRPLVVRRYQQAEEVTRCQILYLTARESATLESIAPRLRSESTLVVSDVAQRGATIGFVTERRRIRLRIDIAAATAARLTISSKLLRIAEVVGPVES